MKKYLLSLFCVLGVLYTLTVAGQNCTSSIGTPVLDETFGAGPNPGPPLAPGITTMGYWTQNYVAGQGYTCPEDGNYSIANYTPGCFNDWVTTTDHTGDPNGYFMIINADYNPDTFYTRTVTGLCGGNIYQFSAWIINLDTRTYQIDPNITFMISQTDGTILDTLSTGLIPIVQDEVWKKYSFYFKTPIGVTDVVLVMKNNAPGGDGNDIGLDDIVFQPVGPGITLGVNGYTGDTISICKQKNPVSLSFTSTVQGCYDSTAYQWQESIDTGQTWTDISGATDSTFTFSANSVGNFQYRLSVAQLGNIGSVTCRVYSSPLYINVLEADSTINKKICLGDSYLGYNKTGTYVDSFFATNGCDSIRTLNLIVIAPPPAPLDTIVGNSILCKGNSVQLSDSDTGGVWHSFDTSIATITDSGFVTTLGTGKVSIHYVVTNMCGTDSALQTLEIEGFPVQNKVADTTSPTCFYPLSGSIAINVSGNEAPYQFKLNGSTYTVPYKVPNLGEGTYAAYIYNNIGCLVDSITNIVLTLINDGSCDTLYVPTGFAPNYANVGNLLKPYGGATNISSITFKVYNRYGNLVFESNNVSDGWDGRINGAVQESGAYVWYLDYTFNSGQQKHSKGTCVLIR